MKYSLLDVIVSYIDELIFQKNGLGEDEYGNIYLLGKSFTKDKLTGTVSMINIS